ncbi:MAG: hypothetical protein AAFZ05_08905 [Pseudomonadota bacterium]
MTAPESQILAEFLDRLPSHLQPTVKEQFELYNLVQREIDGRALNFYRIESQLSFSPRRPLPLLPQIDEPAHHLLKLKFVNRSDASVVHATLQAIQRRAFCISFDRAIAQSEELSFVSQTESWRNAYKRP